MKQFLLCLSLSAFSLLPSYALPATTDGASRFAVSSPMAEGQWVKIAVDTTGVYEISYEALRSMGFHDPEKVGVYGRGGSPYDLNFLSASGERLYSDGLSPVSVIHHEGKLFFYGQGSRSFTLNRAGANMSTEGWFARSGVNIYSDTGCYFLSDYAGPLLMEDAAGTPDPADATPLTHAYSMVSHEKDLFHNNTDTGQLFYGEEIGRNGNNRLEWSLSLPGAIPGANATMECALYYATEDDGMWKYGDSSDSDTPEHEIIKVNTSSLRTLKPLSRQFPLSGPEASIFVELNPSQPSPAVSNLDYWTLTYRRDIPALRDEQGQRLNQETVGFPQVAPGESATLTIPGGADFLALDVTDPSSPLHIPVSRSGDDAVLTLVSGTLPPVLTIFDPLRPQLQIKGFSGGDSRVPNQNLHAEAAEGADLVIICTPALRDVAEKIARLHEEYDGQTSLIATSEECYNEFSSGLPDIMAYRALVKAVYSSPRPCRNVLLIGPLYGDFRGVRTPRDPSAGLIAFQSTVTSQERGAANANDIIGMMADNINTADLHVNMMDVGVGILPLNSSSEARYVLEKIERYLKADDVELYLNAISNIGGFGDRHTHENQAVQLSALIDRLTDYSSVSTILPCDAYGDAGAQAKLFGDLEEGRSIVNYFGHGAPYKLNQSGNFFKLSDVYRLRNVRLPFISFAGCSLSVTDRGYRGLGEALVLDTPYGAIGTMLATRETWSGENAVYFDTFFNALFRDGTDISAPRHSNPPTIGEVYATAKSRVSSNNELAYQLICDPALTLPIVTRSIHFEDLTPELTVGGRVRVSGYIAKADGSGEIDNEFDGKVSLRLMQPVQTLISQDLCTGPSDDALRFQVADRQFSMAVGEVDGGYFSVEMVVPADAGEYVGQTSRIHATAWSSHMRTAAGGLVTGTLRRGDNDLTASDNYPPIIEHIRFDPESLELHVRVSDDVAPSMVQSSLNPAFRLNLDGHDIRSGADTPFIPSADGRTYEKSILLPDLTWGEHRAQVSVRDAAGNVASAETTFTYHPGGADLFLRLSAPAVAESVVITPASAMPENVEFVVLADDGEELLRRPFPEAGLEWDATDATGRRLPPGLYKVYVIQREGALRKSHSDLLPLAVIGQ